MTVLVVIGCTRCSCCFCSKLAQLSRWQAFNERDLVDCSSSDHEYTKQTVG